MANHLWLAKTAGIWEENGKHGRYRVMAYRNPGAAHAWDSVFVDILEQQQGKTRAPAREVRKRIELDVPGYKGYVRDVSFKKINATTMAVLFDLEMKGMEGLVLREIFLVSPNGDARKLVEAKWRDFDRQPRAQRGFPGLAGRPWPGFNQPPGAKPRSVSLDPTSASWAGRLQEIAKQTGARCSNSAPSRVESTF